MNPTVISETKQVFEGVSYWRSCRYFSRPTYQGKDLGLKAAVAGKTRVYLHHAVWKGANGPTPPGHHVHHKDLDRSNNKLSNLELLTRADHLSRHMTEERRQASRERMLRIVHPRAREWHGSPAGRAWHRDHAQRVAAKLAKRKPTKKTCEFCGKTYKAKRPKLSKFCHPNCKARALRARRKLEQSSR